MRLSGFYRDNAGYTDNALALKEDVDASKQQSGLPLVLWQPTEAIAVRATVMAQDFDGADQSFVDVIPSPNNVSMIVMHTVHYWRRRLSAKLVFMRSKNYELGLKGEVLERRVGFDLSLFSVDWTDMQLQQNISGISFPGNGGEARSRGAELSTSFFPIQNFQVISAITYTDAQLTEDAPGVSGLDGDQLPNSPEWAGSVTVDYSRSLGYETELLLGSGYRYRGSIPTGFGLFRTQLDSQETVDAYAGLRIAAAEIRLYAKNVLDDYSGFRVSGGALRGIANSTPRTFILSLDYAF